MADNDDERDDDDDGWMDVGDNDDGGDDDDDWQMAFRRWIIAPLLADNNDERDDEDGDNADERDGDDGDDDSDGQVRLRKMDMPSLVGGQVINTRAVPPPHPLSLSLSDPRHPSHTLSSPSLSSRTRSRVLMMTLMITWRRTWRNTYFLALCCCLGSHRGRETGQK